MLATFAEMLIELCSRRKSSIELPVSVLLLLLFLVPNISALKCYCDPKECDFIGPADCPGRGIIIKDPCKWVPIPVVFVPESWPLYSQARLLPLFACFVHCRCCDVCSKTEGEACGGPGDFSGTCEPSLRCISRLPVTEPGVCTGKQQFCMLAFLFWFFRYDKSSSVLISIPKWDNVIGLIS